MPKLINYGRELIRISNGTKLEYSTNDGRTWMTRYSSSNCGEFIDLLPFGRELLAATSKGLYYSTTEGRTWMTRYSGSSCGEFNTLVDNGRELLAYTSKGLYYSTTQGRTWMKRS